MPKSTIHTTEKGLFKVDRVPDIPDRLKQRGGRFPSMWNWLRDAIRELRIDGDALRVECPNKVEMTRAQAAAQHVNKYKVVPLNAKVITRSEPAPGAMDGTYNLYIKLVERES